MSGTLKCERCGRVLHEDRFAIEGDDLVCDICRERTSHAVKHKDNIMTPFYFTFCLKHPLRGFVQRVFATDAMKARETMVSFYGHKWAYSYSASRVKVIDVGQVDISGFSFRLIPYDLNEGETL